LYLNEVHATILFHKGGTFRQAADGSFSVPEHTEGYYVSRAGAEVAFPIPNLTYQAVEGYTFMQRAALSQPDTYFGAWLNDGMAYLDVSEHVLNYFSAVACGLKNGQLAIWDISAGRSITL
jgi:hypothetical protein